MAELLKGAPVAKKLTAELAERAESLRGVGVVPTLAIVRVGEREDDLSYERGALKRCEKAGIDARRIVLGADASQGDLMDAIGRINADRAIHGCLVFRPLPKHLDEQAVSQALDPAKDVDCMTPSSLLSTLTGAGAGYAPCTAEAVIQLLDHYGVELDGANVVVVGRSLVIGRPAHRDRHDVPYPYARPCRCLPPRGYRGCRCRTCAHARCRCVRSRSDRGRCRDQLG